jgi:ribosomal protein L37E
VGEVHGPASCPRPCHDCPEGMHHWLETSISPDEAEGTPVEAYDFEHDTEHALAHLACKNCDAWKEFDPDAATCECCGDEADGLSADDVPLCNRCGQALEAAQREARP